MNIELHQWTFGAGEAVNFTGLDHQDVAGAGFELLATQHGLLTCSWVCNGLEKVCSERLGVRPNEHGFVDAESDAERCLTLIRKPETGAEPGLWLPFRVTIYS